MAERSPLHIVVLMGGWSAEREVSLMSGKGIVAALESLGHRVTAIDMDRDVAAKLAAAKPDAPGVYVDGAKIASLGLRIRHGCSFHGLALNVDMDLAPFRRINPCGYAGLAMTQLSDHATPIKFAEVSARLRAQLVKHLDYAEQTTLTGGID